MLTTVVLFSALTFVVGFATGRVAARRPKPPINLIDGVTLPSPEDTGWKPFNSPLIWKRRDFEYRGEGRSAEVVEKEFKYTYKALKLGPVIVYPSTRYVPENGLPPPALVRFDNVDFPSAGKYPDEVEAYAKAVWSAYMTRMSLEAQLEDTQKLLNGET